MINPIRTLINDFGIKLDAFGRFTEKKSLDIPRKDVQVVGGQVQTPSMEQNEVDSLYNILKDFQGFSQ